MAGIVHIPWYATLFRGDRFGEALKEIAPLALRFGALDWEVRRGTDDRYRFLQTATFESNADFYAYWEGEEFQRWRARHSGWFQIPVVYEWYDRLGHGQLEVESEAHREAIADPAEGDFAA